jgi:hypothetical protein
LVCFVVTDTSPGEEECPAAAAANDDDNDRNTNTVEECNEANKKAKRASKIETRDALWFEFVCLFVC